MFPDNHSNPLVADHNANAVDISPYKHSIGRPAQGARRASLQPQLDCKALGGGGLGEGHVKKCNNKSPCNLLIAYCIGYSGDWTETGTLESNDKLQKQLSAFISNRLFPNLTWLHGTLPSPDERVCHSNIAKVLEGVVALA